MWVYVMAIPAGVVKNFSVDISRLLLGLGGPYLP